MEAVIEKGIPFPTKGQATHTKWPVRRMEVGDSFAAPIQKRSSLQALATRSSVDGKRFVLRTLKETQQVRVWRIA